MNFEKTAEIESALEHPTTLRVYLFLRYHFDKSSQSIGIRETQNSLKMKSPSIAKWHMDKLEIAGLVDKLSSNRYVLTELGYSLQQRIPVKLPVQMVKGVFVPRIVLLIVFLIVSCITTISISFWNPAFGAANGILTLIVALSLLIWHFRNLRKEMKVFDMNTEET